MSINGFAFPTPIKFGPGARKEVAAHLKSQGLQRPLIVTDRALAALPVLAEFRTHLQGLDVAVYSGVFGNPTAVQTAFGVTGVYGPWTGALSNEGETVTLRDASGNKVDEVSYQLGFPWPTVGDAPS